MARTGRTPSGHWLWTEKEDDIVREFYPDYRALRRKLRRRTRYALKARAARRRKPALTGYPLIDAIRERTFELNLSMVDLDAMAHTGRYFQTSSWHSGNFNRKFVLRAVEVLGGEVSVQRE